MIDHEDLQHQAIAWADEAIRIGGVLVNGARPLPPQRSVLDEHFFLTSITMLSRICKYFSQNSPVPDEAKAAERFYSSSKEAINVRNKREHFDEYIDGTHKRQKEFVNTRGCITADMTSSQVDESGYHLGHDACVQDLVSACLELKKHINPEW